MLYYNSMRIFNAGLGVIKIFTYTVLLSDSAVIRNCYVIFAHNSFPLTEIVTGNKVNFECLSTATGMLTTSS